MAANGNISSFNEKRRSAAGSTVSVRQITAACRHFKITLNVFFHIRTNERYGYTHAHDRFPNKHGGGEEEGEERGEDNKKLQLFLRHGHNGSRYRSGAGPKQDQVILNHSKENGPLANPTINGHFALPARSPLRATAAV